MLAAIAPLIAGTSTAGLAVIPLGYAIWLLARSGWSTPTRVALLVTALAATVGLAIGLLFLLTTGSHD